MKAKIGFEIHVQLNTKQKLFCRCSADYTDKDPNTNICPICTGQPGSKPMPPNLEAIKNVIKVGLILGCKPNHVRIYFLRKHYFYPDLPKNYQITSEPLIIDGNFFGVKIREVHLEEDPGRYDLRNGYVDFNRSGTPLAEIVTEPDIESPEHAKGWLEKLFLYLKYSRAIRADPGSIRVDVNVSIEGGERVEIKNVNSIDGVYRSLKYEILRQTRMLIVGKRIKRETRHYDDEKRITVPLREKEDIADYRYIPDPDLIPIEISESLIDNIKRDILSPIEYEKILKNKYNLKENYIQKLLQNPEFLELCIYVLKNIKKEDPNRVAEILTNHVWRVIKDTNLEFHQIKNLQLVRNIERLLTILNRVDRNKLCDIVSAMLLNSEDPVNYAKKKRYLLQEVDKNKIISIVKEILTSETKAVNDYLNGKKKALSYLVGKVMSRLEIKPNPKTITEIIKEEICRTYR